MQLHLRLIKLKGHFSVLAGRCWRTINQLIFLFGCIFNPTHQFLCWCLFFLSVPSGWVWKHCGKKLGGVYSVNSLPKVHSKVHKYHHKNCCGLVRMLFLLPTTLQSTFKGRSEDKQSSTATSGGWLGKELTRAAGESRRHRQMKGDNGGNKALPRTSIIIGSDKRRGGDGGVAMMAAAAKGSGSGQWRQQQIRTAEDGNGGRWQRHARSGSRLWLGRTRAGRRDDKDSRVAMMAAAAEDGSSRCENIHSWISLSGDLVFSQQQGIYSFKLPKRYLEISSRDLTLFSILII